MINLQTQWYDIRLVVILSACFAFIACSPSLAQDSLTTVTGELLFHIDMHHNIPHIVVVTETDSYRVVMDNDQALKLKLLIKDAIINKEEDEVVVVATVSGTVTTNEFGQHYISIESIANVEAKVKTTEPPPEKLLLEEVSELATQLGIYLGIIAAVFLDLLIRLGLPILTYLLLRYVTVQIVYRLMIKKSDRVTEKEGYKNYDTSQRNQVPVVDVEFVEIESSQGILLNRQYEERLSRAQYTGRRTIWFNVFSLIAFSLTTGFVYFVESGYLVVGLLMFLVAIFISLLFIFILICSYLSLTRLPITIIKLYSIILIVLSVIPYFTSHQDISLIAAILPSVAQISTLLFLYRRNRQKLYTEGNLKLLIMRVFDSNKNTAFLFGKLIKYWRYLGSYVTIVDPSYIKYEYQLFSRHNIRQIKYVVLLYFICFALATGFLYLFYNWLPEYFPDILTRMTFQKWLDIYGQFTCIFRTKLNTHSV